MGLNQIEKVESPEKIHPKTKGTSKRKRDTPSPKASVTDKRKILEEKLAKKYQAQRCAKGLIREKNKLKKEKSKKESPDKESSFAALLREMRDDIKDIKSDNRDIKHNMQQMNTKIVTIETKQKENEEKTATELQEIRTEMRNNQETLQDTITANVISQINPIVNEKQTQLPQMTSKNG